MRELIPHKKTTFTIFIIILVVGVIFVYAENRRRIIAEKNRTPSDITPPIAEVRGEEKTVPSSSTSGSNLGHLELTVKNIVWYTNHYRAEHNLPPLGENWRLDNSASMKISDMIKRQYFEHARPGTDQGFEIFIDNQNYEFIKVGENLAMGDFQTSKEVVDAWMASPSHKKNILDDQYINIGVSIQSGIMHGKNVVFIVQHFGKPKSVCPGIDASLKSDISELQQQVNTFKQSISATQNQLQETSIEKLEYAKIIIAYNALVDKHNNAVEQLGELITLYNSQVMRLDQCIGR